MQSSIMFRRLSTVLDRMFAQCKADANDALCFADVLPVTAPTQEAVLAWISRAQLRAAADQEYAEMLSTELEGVLNILAESDFFGTERQNDPRGDGRDGDWSMTRVQGFDS